MLTAQLTHRRLHLGGCLMRTRRRPMRTVRQAREPLGPIPRPPRRHRLPRHPELGSDLTPAPQPPPPAPPDTAAPPSTTPPGPIPTSRPATSPNVTDRQAADGRQASGGIDMSSITGSVANLGKGQVRWRVVADGAGSSRREGAGRDATDPALRLIDEAPSQDLRQTRITRDRTGHTVRQLPTCPLCRSRSIAAPRDGCARRWRAVLPGASRHDSDPPVKIASQAARLRRIVWLLGWSGP
jgi:hypothetical protein